jgi:YHS domain-containing protein
MKAIDPVCKMEVDTGSEWHTDYKGTTYYFCSKGCLDTFSKNPKKYAKDQKEHQHSKGCC